MLSAVFSGLSRYLQTSCVPVSTRRVAPVGFPFLNTVATVRFRGPKWLVCAQVQAACPQRLRNDFVVRAGREQREHAARKRHAVNSSQLSALRPRPCFSILGPVEPRTGFDMEGCLQKGFSGSWVRGGAAHLCKRCIPVGRSNSSLNLLGPPPPRGPRSLTSGWTISLWQECQFSPFLCSSEKVWVMVRIRLWLE